MSFSLRRLPMCAAALSLLGLGAGLLVHSPASLAETVSKTFTATSCTVEIIGDIDQLSSVTISGDFPDEVTPGSTFTVKNLKVVIDNGINSSRGPVVRGPILDLGTFGTMEQLPDAEIQSGGAAIFEGKSTHSIDEVTLTAPTTVGSLPVQLNHINFASTNSGLFNFDCDFDPATSVLTTIRVAAPTTPTTPTSTPTTTPAVPSKTPASPGGSAAQPATAVSADPSFTG